MQNRPLNYMKKDMVKMQQVSCNYSVESCIKLRDHNQSYLVFKELWLLNKYNII